MSSGLRGTDATQDSVSWKSHVKIHKLIIQRFKDKEALSIKSTKFPKCFDTKVTPSLPSLTKADGLGGFTKSQHPSPKTMDRQESNGDDQV